MPDGASLREAISIVRSRISDACRRSGRSPQEVTLVAVTKTVPIDVVRKARQAGIEHFAENYANELKAKAPEVPATWHFIGKLQRGTAGHVADHATVVHSAEPGEALQRIAARAARTGTTIRCLVQVDFTGGRNGVPPEDIPGFAATAEGMVGISLVGLMTLPPWSGDPEATRRYFARLRELRDALQRGHPAVQELSMGMSGDYEVAVEEGATMVRVGRSIFGPRPGKQTR
jgi:pyridoxal phosphate enzyme (YggS family)